jgi:hypothetical protein
MPKALDLETALEIVSVHDDREAAVAAGNTYWPVGWFAVSIDTRGVVAYFEREEDAYRFRLDTINRLCNPTRPDKV